MVARHMGVTMENEIHTGRRGTGRNVFEVDPEAFQFKVESQRPFFVGVTVSPHKTQREAHRAEDFQDRRGADVAEVPDLICAGEFCRQSRRHAVMGIGEDGDAHGGRWRVPARPDRGGALEGGRISCPSARWPARRRNSESRHAPARRLALCRSGSRDSRRGR